MLKVLPIQSKAEQEALCQKCNIEFKPELLAYAASVDGDLVGICQFKLTAEGGVLFDLAKVVDHVEPTAGSDFEAMFVMGRGTLNFIDLCGVHSATFVGSADEALLRAIGFRQNENGGWTINLEGFFTDHCGNHKSS
ncbi:MAG: hypothetical protein J6Q82_02320 [Clostridia bacterium]|nr:hypothetical protein [Clostridia bacterium]